MPAECLARTQARLNGDKFYYSEKPCKRGHLDKRSTLSGNCYTCTNLRKLNARIADNYESTRRQSKEYAQRFPAKRAANCSRCRARKLQATPSWANKDLIEVFYIKAKLMERLTGEKYHVDHVIPLKGKNVCGLHVENNLQVITAKANLQKFNNA